MAPRRHQIVARQPECPIGWHVAIGPAGAPEILAEHLSPPLVIQSIEFHKQRKATICMRNCCCARWRGRSSGSDGRGGIEGRRGFPARHRNSGWRRDPIGRLGLARDDLVTPRAMVMLLRYAARQPWGNHFMSTLPVAGVDGTLGDRMKNSAATGLIEAKTARSSTITRCRATRRRCAANTWRPLSSATTMRSMGRSRRRQSTRLRRR